MAINMLRSSFITHVKDSSEGTQELMESIASAMRHSTRYQTSVYDRRTSNQRLRSGIAYTSAKTSRALSGNDTETTPTKRTKTSKFSKGETVAVFAADSTPTNPKILFGRVTNEDDDGLVSLSRFREVETGYYRIKIGGATWKEKESALISGIDMCYDSTKKSYELRTVIDDIVDGYKVEDDDDDLVTML